MDGNGNNRHRKCVLLGKLEQDRLEPVRTTCSPYLRVIIKDYLNDREVKVENHSLAPHALAYVRVLSVIRLPEGLQHAMTRPVIIVMDKQELVYKGARLLRNISEWITLDGLKKARHKIEALVVKGKEG